MEQRQHNYVQVHNIRIHYVTAGSGPLLLLLHGFPECWYSWHDQLARFCQDFTVVIPDLRGCNDSDKPHWGYESDVLMMDMIALITTLGFDRAIVAGHDWGGFLAWGMAIFYPQRIERLITLNAPHPALLVNGAQTGWKQKLHHLLFAWFRLPLLPEKLLSAKDYALIEWILRRGTQNSLAFSKDTMEIYKDAISKPGSLSAMLNWYRSDGRIATHWLEHPVCSMFRGKNLVVEVPTLMIWGEKDYAFDPALAHTINQYAPNSDFVVLPNCSHQILQEQPEMVGQHIKRFLRG